jgi:feruloyl-CoA synthase
MVLEQEPSFDKGEITEKGSLNQRALRGNHKKLVAAMYAGEEDVLTV